MELLKQENKLLRDRIAELEADSIRKRGVLALPAGDSIVKLTRFLRENETS